MNFQPDSRQLALLKTLLIAACMLPAARLLAFDWSMPDSPALTEEVQRWTGTWTLNFLLLTLCISPLRSLTGMHWLLRLRRLIGLTTFAYALLHLLAFIGLEHAFHLQAIARDSFKRPYVSAGLAAFVLLIPLAATSSQWAVRQLGGRRWQELHRNIYLIGILACIHYLWLSDGERLPWALACSLALAALLAWRVRERRRKAVPVARSASVSPIRFFPRKPD